MTAEPGIRFGIGNGLLVVVSIAASLARLNPTEAAWLGVLTGGLSSIGLRWPVSVTMGVIAWAWFTGFVENSYGLLTFAGDDLRRLAVFCAVALALAMCGRRVQQGIKANDHG